MQHISNFLQVMPGGHCYFCHKDYADTHDWEQCRQLNEANYYAPCDGRCKESKFYNAGKKLFKDLKIGKDGKLGSS